MVDLDVLLEKGASIQKCLKRIHDAVGDNLDSLDDITIQDVVVLNLQRAVQLVIDCAFHIASAEQMGLPKNLRDVFSILMENDVIDSSLAQKMEKMVGFRNIAVHDYQAINYQILQKIIKNHLVDIEEFYITIMKRYQ